MGPYRSLENSVTDRRRTVDDALRSLPHSRMPSDPAIAAMTGSVAESESRRSNRAGRPWIWLAVIVVGFLTIRLPVMFHHPGSYDEDFYAVPGLTVLQSGIPRLPHLPARNVESAYYHADQALYAEPPLYFYVQAAFYAVLPHVYGTARLASAISGIALLLLVYHTARFLGGSETAALWGAGLFSCSRWFYFPAICARPDILCSVWGLSAVLCMLHWERTRKRRTLALAGIFLGLGGLTHPFAILYAFQLAVWGAWSSRRWARLGTPLLLATVALAVFSLWLPLILKHPDVFRVQFRNQFTNESGGSLWWRVLMPAASMRYQFLVMWNHLGPVQFCASGIGLLAVTAMSFVRRDTGLRTICLLAWSAMFLICVMVGTHHPVIGYWSYPAALIFIGAGIGLAALVDVLARERRTLSHGHQQAAHAAGTWTRRSLVAGVTLAGLLLMVPGSGLRAAATYLREWNNINYDAPRFARRLIKELPADGVYAVDTQFVLDFVAAGRSTLLATTYPPYLRVNLFAYDRLIASRFAMDYRIAEELGGPLLRTEGVRDDVLACYAEIYGSHQPEAP